VAVKTGADRTNLPERVDVVLIVETYHHIPNRVTYFTALKALMKPGADHDRKSSARRMYSPLSKP